MNDEVILLGHGSGTGLTQQLIDTLFAPAFGSNPQGDSALVNGNIAVTTDCHVVSPLFFEGGDIGRLAVAGTVNDLVVAGATPLALTAGFIIEEGFSMANLRKIVESMSKTATEANVKIVAGDTKVVPKGQADGCYITTTGVGSTLAGGLPKFSNIKPGHGIIITGYLGCHALAIANQREQLGLTGLPPSDCAPLNSLLLPLWHNQAAIYMQDPTRGGVAGTLHEFAKATSLGFELDENALPLHPATNAACQLLGLEPLHLANEGKAVIISADPDKTLAILHKHSYGQNAVLCGQVTSQAGVYLRTQLGSTRKLTLPMSDQLPRIC